MFTVCVFNGKLMVQRKKQTTNKQENKKAYHRKNPNKTPHTYFTPGGPSRTSYTYAVSTGMSDYLIMLLCNFFASSVYI